MTRKKTPAVRREEIFEAALRCFNDAGYHRTTIDAIAASIGISKGGIYYHFGSKKALFIELYKSKVNRYFDEVSAPLQQASGADQILRDLLRRSEEVFHEHLDVLRFLLEFAAIGSRDAAIRRELTETYQNRVTVFRQLIQKGIDDGIFKPVDSANVARVLYFLSMGFFLTCFTVDIDFDPIAHNCFNIETLLTGIQQPGAETDRSVHS